MDDILMRHAEETDLAAIAHINSSVFLGDRDRVEGAKEWVGAWLKAFPLYQYFVVEANDTVVGYAGWQLHGGFHRAEPVIELDQIGIDQAYQGNGLAPQLTKYSIREMAAGLRQKNNRIESHISFVVWVYALNFNAISVYAKDFTDGVCGMRTQFGSRAEVMLRLRMPIVMPVRA
jgi:ribosomal protein S18 acetylase RimI-like enzyme